MGGRPAPLAMTTLRERMLTAACSSGTSARSPRYAPVPAQGLQRGLSHDRQPRRGEDVAQEVSSPCQAHRHVSRDAKFSTWLYRIANQSHAQSMKYLGRRAHNHTSELDEAPSASWPRVAAERDAPAHRRARRRARGLQLERVVQQGIAALEPEHREVLVCATSKTSATRRSLPSPVLPKGP